MKALLVISMGLLAACSSQVVRCDSHLTRINPPQKLLGGAGQIAPQAKTTKKLAVQSSSTKSQVMPPAGQGETP
jgi:hypothetical protein